MVTSNDPFVALVRDPFALVQAMDARYRRKLQQQSQPVSAEDTWVGLAYRIRGTDFVSAQNEVREVLTPSQITRVPGAKRWLMGLANVRGELVPMIDLGFLFAQEPLLPQRLNRVLLVQSGMRSAGMVVDELYGFRRFSERQLQRTIPDRVANFGLWLDGQFVQDEHTWLVLNLNQLLLSEAVLDAAA